MIEGDLCFANVRDWLTRADELSAGESLDLSRVGRVDSAGAALLLELTRRARARGHELELRNASQSLRGLLEFLQIDRVLKLG